ncbi:CRISPR-associated endonuclease Cas3'' [Endozoicomonas sp.]|nr:CRISPR-associated endonuclease Cas3'' [Endozoicomonas sp.]
MDKNDQYVAHTAFNDDGTRKPDHSLFMHLSKVSGLAANFAEKFGKDWAALAGRWHDLGKYQPAFQDYIKTSARYEAENAHVEVEEKGKPKSKRVSHSTAGATHAIEKLGAETGSVLAYLIAGHHAGLPDWSGGKKSTLKYRLENGSKNK